MPYIRPAGQRIAAKSGLDPIVAVALITALVQLATACLTPAEALHESKRKHGRRRRRLENVVYRRLRDEKRADDYPAVMHAIDAELESMTVEGMEACFADLQDQTADYGD